jgi:small-conductance mechanosensitive channel
MRRGTLQLTLPRGTKLESILGELPDVLQRTTAIAPEPAPTATITGLNGDGIVIEIIFWTSAEAETLGDARSHAILAVDQLLSQYPSVNVK